MDYNHKTKEELAAELRLRDILETERGESDKRYAIKIVEKIVFALVGALALAVLGGILRLVIH